MKKTLFVLTMILSMLFAGCHKEQLPTPQSPPPTVVQTIRNNNYKIQLEYTRINSSSLDNISIGCYVDSADLSGQMAPHTLFYQTWNNTTMPYFYNESSFNICDTSHIIINAGVSSSSNDLCHITVLRNDTVIYDQQNTWNENYYLEINP